MKRFPPSPRGIILKGWLACLFMAAAITVLIVLLWMHTRAPVAHGDRLFIYCAAGIKPPVEAVLNDYKSSHEVSTQLQFGGSNTLLASLELSHQGDLFIAADETYIRLAREKNLLAEAIPLAVQHPVIVVRKGNPKAIHGIADLLRSDVTSALADPDQASIGRSVRAAFRESGQWESLRSHLTVLKPTVNDVANDVKVGAVDAGIVWDATARQYPELEIVQERLFYGVAETVTIGVLKSSPHPAAALKFARYLAAKDKGQPIFQRFGYTPVDGDPWEETPEIIFYSGAVNRPAVEETIKAFEMREGVRVTRVFNGCGILVGQMKAGGRPDAYLTCDASFATPVADLLEGTPLPLSDTTIVILTPKGNPHNIRTLADLASPGLKVGVANPRESTLGALTQHLLENAGLVDQVMANVRSQTPTADMLVNQLRSGALDVVVVYDANTRKAQSDTEVIPLNIPGAIAVQTFSVGKESRHKQLVNRLLDALRSQQSQASYEASGFHWRLAATTRPATAP